MKLILSTIVVGIVLFLLGWLFYGFLLANFFKEYYGHLSRGDADMKVWAFGVASFIQAFFLYLIYSKGYQGGSPIMEGFRFGSLIGLLSGVPYVFFTWGGMPVQAKGVIVDGIVIVFMMGVAGVITGLIYGKKDIAIIKAP